MKDEKITTLWIGDGFTPTGFATVNHNIIDNLPKGKYDVHHLAINYFGDPHPYDHKMYPATSIKFYHTGDLWGYHRLPELLNNLEPDIVFMLNDIWVQVNYLEIIKDKNKVKKIPKIVSYFPVDGKGYDSTWFKDFDIVSQAVVYTQFGYDVVKKAVPDLDVKIIPHGTESKHFYKLDNKHEAKAKIYHDNKKLHGDSFIVLNANRNQPRKKLDISLTGFALFAKDKPENVQYYHHAGLKDVGWDIIKLIKRIDEAHGTDIEKRFIITNINTQVQNVPKSHLNLIYNAADVGINTSTGEGWGLTNSEHAAVGVPQVVPNHTACTELFRDCGILLPIKMAVRDEQSLLMREFVSPESLAEALEKLYTDKDFYKEKADACYNKFTSPRYGWKTIGNQWDKIFTEVLDESN